MKPTKKMTAKVENVHYTDASLHMHWSPEWHAPELQDSRTRLAKVVERLGLSHNIYEKLCVPKRVTLSAVPARMEDGTIRTFSGYMVNHSDTLGPCQGQLRYHPDLNIGQVMSLAMAQTFKSALMGLPLGGAQGGVRCNPNTHSKKELERITRRYTTEMVPVLGPDRNVLSPGLGTDEQTMAWIMDTYSQMHGHAVRQVVTGKPRIIGGSGGRQDAPGRSTVYCIMETAKKLNFTLDKNTRVAIQGFGKLGRSAFRKLVKLGCRVVAVNDINSGVFSDKGLNYDDLMALYQEGKQLRDYKKGESIQNDELLTLDCEVLLPAATANQITKHNAPKIKARILAEGSSDCTTLDADDILTERGIFVIPDIIANAGGIVLSYFEWVQGLQSFLWDDKEINQRLYRIIKETYDRAYEIAEREKISMRDACLMAGVAKIARAISLRGLYP